MPSGVVCATWSMYGKSSSRFEDARGAAEVVERERGVPALGEPQRELLVEAVETADVGEDDHADPRAVVGEREEPGNLGAVGRLEDEILGAHGGAAGDRRDRRDGVELEAHGSSTLHRPGRPETGEKPGQPERMSASASAVLI